LLVDAYTDVSRNPFQFSGECFHTDLTGTIGRAGMTDSDNSLFLLPVFFLTIMLLLLLLLLLFYSLREYRDYDSKILQEYHKKILV